MVTNKTYLLRKEKTLLKIEVLPELSEIAGLIHSLKDFFCKHNFSLMQANEICLVIEEITANTIMHGYKDIKVQDREKISIEVECNEGNKVSILFKDSGIPFDPTLPRPPREKDRVGGWGLLLIKKIVYDLKYERCGKYNIVRFSKQYI